MVYCIYLRVNGFPFIMQSKALEGATGPFYSPDRVDPEAYGRTSELESAFRYVTYALIDMLLDAKGTTLCTS